MRTILHCDCNSFYSTVEIASNPLLRGKPMAVCGDPAMRHGIILAKSAEAKACGIYTGEVLWEAKKKCPQLHLIVARHTTYLEYARALRSICRRYTPFVEPFGLDECWLDVSHHALSGEEIAAQIRQAARTELGVTASVGVSFNKVFAKLASDLRKPDATVIITEKNFQTKAWRQPVDSLLYVGRATKRRLAGMGIHTVGDLANCDTDLLHRLFGKNGLTMQRFARGQDETPVLSPETADDIKSIGNSTTPPHDVRSIQEAKPVLYLLSESVATRMRRHGMACCTVSLSLRDTSLACFGRQIRLPAPTDMAEDIAAAALQLLYELYGWELPLRSLGVSASGLISTLQDTQTNLLMPVKKHKNKNLEEALDEIRKRYGHNAVRRGIVVWDSSLSQLNPVDNHSTQALSAMHGRE